MHELFLLADDLPNADLPEQVGVEVGDVPPDPPAPVPPVALQHPLLLHFHKSMMILLLKRDLINLRTSRKLEVEVALLLVLLSPTSCLTADTQSVFAIHQGSGGK